MSANWILLPGHINIHESMARDITVKITNKMKLYRLIYYSKSALHVIIVKITNKMQLHRLYTPQKPHSSVSTRTRHQPAATWVNITRYCKYSQVLLMMGENIARNM
jgi:hypothetical protein